MEIPKRAQERAALMRGRDPRVEGLFQVLAQTEQEWGGDVWSGPFGDGVVFQVDAAEIPVGYLFGRGLLAELSAEVHRLRDERYNGVADHAVAYAAQQALLNGAVPGVKRPSQGEVFGIGFMCEGWTLNRRCTPEEVERTSRELWMHEQPDRVEVRFALLTGTDGFDYLVLRQRGGELQYGAWLAGQGGVSEPLSRGLRALTVAATRPPAFTSN